MGRRLRGTTQIEAAKRLPLLLLNAENVPLLAATAPKRLSPLRLQAAFQPVSRVALSVQEWRIDFLNAMCNIGIIIYNIPSLVKGGFTLYLNFKLPLDKLVYS